MSYITIRLQKEMPLIKEATIEILKLKTLKS